MKYLKTFIFLLIILAPIQLTSSQNDEVSYKWKKISGKWKTVNSLLIQRRLYGIRWGYHELVNYNSIMSFQSLVKPLSLSFKILIKKSKKNLEPNIMIPFAAKSPLGNLFYDFYAFKLCGDEKEIHSSSLIQSRWKDPSKSFRKKYNYVIETLATEPVRLAYDKMHTIRITMDNKRLVLFINKKKIISYNVKKDNYNGYLGFSVRNAYLAIDDVVVKDTNGNIILEDKFNTSSIYIRRIKGRIKSTPKK